MSQCLAHSKLSVSDLCHNCTGPFCRRKASFSGDGRHRTAPSLLVGKQMGTAVLQTHRLNGLCGCPVSATDSWNIPTAL